MTNGVSNLYLVKVVQLSDWAGLARKAEQYGLMAEKSSGLIEHLDNGRATFFGIEG